MRALIQDFRHGARLLLQAPGFALVATLTLALGIGANTAIFSIADAVLLHPLPYAHASRLLSLQAHNAQGPAGISFQEFRDLQKHANRLRAMAAYGLWPMNYSWHGQTRFALGGMVSPGFFHLLGIKAAAGRLWTHSGGEQTREIIISHHFWQRNLHGAVAALGSQLTLGGGQFTIIGILPRGERFPFMTSATGLWAPLSRASLRTTFIALFRSLHMNPFQVTFFDAIAETAPGVSRKAAQAQAQTLLTSYLKKHHPKRQEQVRLRPLAQVAAQGLSRSIWLLLAATGAMLMIACANLANLVMARITARRPEIATRHALGASRGRLARQLFMENLAFTLPGAGLGLFLAAELLRVFHTMLLPYLFNFRVVAVNLDVLLFSGLAAVTAALLFGLLPVWQFSGWTAPEALRQPARNAGEARALTRARQGLVVVEIALALVLLAGAGLLIRSLILTLEIRPGFNPRRLLLAQVQLPQTQFPTPASWNQFVAQARSQFEAQPGVENTAAAVSPPMAPERITISSTFHLPGQTAGKQGRQAQLLPVTPGYFQSMQIPLLAGRDFNGADTAGGSRVCIVNRKLAQAAFGGQNPLGRRLMVSKKTMPGGCQVVGLAGNTIAYSLRQAPQPAIYLPYTQLSLPYIGFLIRTKLPAAGMRKQIQGMLRRQFPGLHDFPVFSIHTLMQRQSSLASDRFRAGLALALGGLALLLTAIGVYGVASYNVSRETHAIGIRMALGAEPRDILRSALGQGLRLAAAGAGIGLAAAWLALRVLRHFLFHVSASDPLTLGAVTVTLLLITVLASLIPARRAAGLDPNQALRDL